VLVGVREGEGEGAKEHEKPSPLFVIVGCVHEVLFGSSGGLDVLEM
jgi:hypothetical protein